MGALYIATDNHNMVLLDLLLRHGASTDTRSHSGHTPLLQAIEANQLDVVRALLVAGADPNERHRDDEESFPLSFAACKAYDDIVRLLLDHGADLESRDKYDCTAVINVAIAGHLSTMQILLERGANRTSCAVSGYHALLAATNGKHLEMARLLLQTNDAHGPQPTLQLHEGFYWACASGDMDMVMLFLDNGCNPATECLVSGQFPIFGAVHSGKTDLADSSSKRV